MASCPGNAAPRCVHTGRLSQSQPSRCGSLSLNTEGAQKKMKHYHRRRACLFSKKSAQDQTRPTWTPKARRMPTAVSIILARPCPTSRHRPRAEESHTNEIRCCGLVGRVESFETQELFIRVHVEVPTFWIFFSPVPTRVFLQVSRQSFHAGAHRWATIFI